jgi:hypothetical protein
MLFKTYDTSIWEELLWEELLSAEALAYREEVLVVVEVQMWLLVEGEVH